MVLPFIFYETNLYLMKLVWEFAGQENSPKMIWPSFSTISSNRLSKRYWRSEDSESAMTISQKWLQQCSQLVNFFSIYTIFRFFLVKPASSLATLGSCRAAVLVLLVDDRILFIIQSLPKMPHSMYIWIISKTTRLQQQVEWLSFKYSVKCLFVFRSGAV